MSKRIVMSVLFSVVCSIVTMVGSFSFRGKEDKHKVFLVIVHPDSCFLLDPQPMASETTSADTVSVPEGKKTFKFDCNGKQVELEHDVESGKLIWNVDPLNPSRKAEPALAF